MRIHLIAIGTLKERYFTAAYEEYAKRLSRYADVRLTELKEERLPRNPATPRSPAPSSEKARKSSTRQKVRSMSSTAAAK